MTNDEMIKGLQLLDDNLTQFDELCGSDGKWVDVHELIWETVEALQAKEIRDGKPDSERIGEYNIIYHGDRLYSIRRVDRDAVVLLHADSPHDAWRKAVKMYE